MPIFDDMLLRGVRKGHIPARTKDARKWFRGAARKTKVTPSKMFRDDVTRFRDRVAVGKMYMYFYDPKHKATLPYYDTFPLVFPIERYSDGFLGINFHYLPLPLRARLMDNLYDITSNKKFDDSTKIKATYSLLNGASKFKHFRPTVKRYLVNHIRSRFLFVHPTEWDMALFLPVQKFQKAKLGTVYADSRSKIK